MENNCNLLVVSLTVDEMAILSQLTFHGEKYIAGVNKGEFGLNEDVATGSLVFMVVGVNCHFKLPVGYFLIKKWQLMSAQIWWKYVCKNLKIVVSL